MREIELSETKKASLRVHTWVQHAASGLADGEVVLIRGVGECIVRRIANGLVELWTVRENRKP